MNGFKPGVNYSLVSLLLVLNCANWCFPRMNCACISDD